MRRTRIFQAATLVSLVGLVGVVTYIQVNGIDARADARYRARLIALRDHDAALDTALLRARSGLVNHFDEIVSHTRARRDTQRELLGILPEHLGAEARRELRSRLEVLDRAIAEQEDQVERFKMHHAVLRNSMRYLPHAARELIDTVVEDPNGAALAGELNALFTEVLLFHDFGERSRIPRVRARLEALQSSPRPELSPEQATALRLLSRHSEVILNRKVRVEELVQDIERAPVPQEVAALSGIYLRHHRAVVAELAQWRLVAFILALLSVVLGAAAVIFRLKYAARALSEAKTGLESALVELEGEKEKQKELATLKSRFVSMTSHEFRTPLSVILSSAELLEAYGERWKPEKRNNHLGRIQRAAGQMKQMLDAVLLIGRSEAGMLRFEPKEIDVEAFVRELCDGLEFDADTKHEVALTTDGELSSVILDERLLGHVVSNLLSNAMRYSPDADTVYLDVARDDQTVELRVRDEGIGIPEEDRERLFDSFHRGSNVSGISGTGLGLAIVDRAVDLQGGTIEVESELGTGTTFIVRLPIDHQVEAGRFSRPPKRERYERTAAE